MDGVQGFVLAHFEELFGAEAFEDTGGELAV
jgi:hypothetical protein